MKLIPRRSNNARIVFCEDCNGWVVEVREEHHSGAMWQTHVTEDDVGPVFETAEAAGRQLDDWIAREVDLS